MLIITIHSAYYDQNQHYAEGGEDAYYDGGHNQAYHDEYYNDQYYDQGAPAAGQQPQYGQQVYVESCVESSRETPQLTFPQDHAGAARARTKNPRPLAILQ